MEKKQNVVPLPVQAKPESYLVSSIETGVLVPLLQNIAGGIGVFVMVTTLAAVVKQQATVWDTLSTVPLVPGLILGLVVTSGATIIRAFRDEVGYMLARWAEHTDWMRHTADLARIAELEHQLHALQSQGQPSNRYASQADAEKLLTWRFEHGGKISRSEAMTRLSMPRPAWERATELLQNAGVINARSEFVIGDAAEAWRAVIRYTASSRQFVRTADGDFAPK